MNEKIKTALQKIMADPDLSAQFRNCKTPDECYAVAGSLEDGFTKEEFVAAMEALQAAIERTDELSDEDLSKAAGGIDWKDVGIGASASVVSAGAAIASAAI